MDSVRETFSKQEKLCSIKIISGLFESGKSFHTTLFRVVWDYSPVELPYPVSIAFSVSKRSFRLAVKRNLIKRRMREAWRKQKHLLYKVLEEQNRQLVLVVILRGGELPSYAIIEKGISELAARLIKAAERV
jgi:ribonuclease P protein component